jgi:hypothetical protein
MRKTLLSLLLAAVTCAGATDPVALVGTVTNTTNPKQPISADALMTFDKDGHCILKISPPLYGSGACALKTYDEKTGYTEITSEGALLNITATGTTTGASMTGSYKVESPSTPDLPQSGTFQFTVVSGSQTPLQLSDVLSWDTFKSGDEEFLIIRDGEVVSVHHKDGKYAGLRLILGKDGNPTHLVQDTDTTSIYRDFKTKKVLLTWVKEGENGYFMQPVSGGIAYLDKFLQPTGWSSIEVNKQTIFLHEVGEHVELFDSDIKPLGIRSAKTTSGKIFWSKTTDNVTEYFDQAFKPLGWYSIQMNGETYYARARGKNKFTFYDANMRELKKPRQDGFWASFARGMATGLAAYGNAMQQAAAYRTQQTQGYAAVPRSYIPYSYTSTTMAAPAINTTTTTDSLGSSYITNSQQMGNFTFSNTTGSNGYTANSTTTRLGTFDFINGSSSVGNFSGSSNRLGNFDFMNLTTPAGTWNGTSTQVGNFTFHNFVGPSGQTMSGTTTRIGDFIFTNIH